MSAQTIADLIGAHPFFAGLGPGVLALVAGCGQNRHAAAGEYLAREGDSAANFYLIRSGLVAVETNVPGRGAVVLETLGPGDIAGWSWLFPPYVWTFDLRAAASTSVVELNGVCLRDKCEADPRLGYEVAKRLAGMMVGRLGAARLRLLDLYGVPAP